MTVQTPEAASTRILLAVRIAAALCAGLGLAVMLGWATRTTWLIQVHPALVPMQFNTALGMLLSGAALLLVTLERKGAALACASVVGAIGLLTLAEYVLGVNLGIDQLLMKHYITVKTVDPGRMAPSTAFCFILSGTAIALTGRARPTAHWPLATGLISSLVLAIGVGNILGYLTGTETFSLGRHAARMAVHASAGFAVLGTGWFLLAWRAGAAGARRVPAWLPVPVFMALATLTFAIWQGWLAHQRRQEERLVEAETAHLEHGIRDAVEARIRTLKRMAHRWDVRGGTPRAEWEADAADIVAQERGFHAIQRIDPSFHVRWSVPPEGRGAGAQDGAVDGQIRPALEAAREGREARISGALDLGAVSTGFLVCVPLFPGDRFDGFLAGVFHIDELLAPVLERERAAGYEVAVFDGQRLLCGRPELHADLRDKWVRERPVELAGATWRAAAWPTPQRSAAARSFMPHAALAVGLLMAALAAVAVWLGMTASAQAQTLAGTNRQLEHEVAERRQAQQALQALTSSLEQRVAERTAELQQRASELALANQELERFNRLAVHREHRMIELKRQVNELCAALDKPPPYDLGFADHDRVANHVAP